MFHSEDVTRAESTRAVSMVINRTNYCIRLPELESWLYHLPVMRLWVGYSLWTSVLKNGGNNSTFISLVEPAAIWNWSMQRKLTYRKDEGRRKREEH